MVQFRPTGMVWPEKALGTHTDLWLTVALTQIGYIFDYLHGLHFAAYS